MKIKRITNVVIAAFMLFISGCNCCKSEKTQLKVATYNIQMAPKPTDIYWQTRKDAAKDLLAYYKFDIWGSQETFLHQIQYVLPEGYDFVGVGRDDGKTQGEYSPVCYNKNKLQLLDSGTFWISETPEKVSKGWDAMCRRVCSWGQFKDKKTGKIFFFFNTHLDHRGEKARIEGVKLLMKKVKEISKGQTYFLTGDFNITPEHKALKPMFASKDFIHVRDVCTTKPYGPDATYHAYTGIPFAFIDYIFASPNVKVLDYRVVTDRIGERAYEYKENANNNASNLDSAPSGMNLKKLSTKKILKKQTDVDYASDHCPVVSTVEF